MLDVCRTYVGHDVLPLASSSLGFPLLNVLHQLARSRFSVCPGVDVFVTGPELAA